MGVPAEPPFPSAAQLPQARFFLGLEPSPRLRWPAANGVVERPIPPGSLLFLPAYSWNWIPPTPPRHHVGIVLHRGYVRFLIVNHTGGPLLPSAGCYFHTAHPAPAAVNELLVFAADASAPARRTCLRAAVHLLVEHLVNDTSQGASISEHLFHSVAGYVADHLGEPLDRAGVAAAFGRHPNHISRLFKEYGDCTFQQYLTRVRLEQARDLLLHTNQPIKALCAACGYERQSHFGTRFRERYGTSPGAYRAAHRGTPA